MNILKAKICSFVSLTFQWASIFLNFLIPCGLNSTHLNFSLFPRSQDSFVRMDCDLTIFVPSNPIEVERGGEGGLVD